MSSGFDRYKLNKLKGFGVTNNWPNQQLDQDAIIKKAKNAVMEKLKAEYEKHNKPIFETDEDKVIRILRKDFEAKHGMTFDKFIEIYNKILANSPEKLI